MQLLRTNSKGEKELWLQGEIISNDDAQYYDYIDKEYGVKYDYVCPNNIIDTLSVLQGEDVIVKIDGYGGNMYAASTIYNEFMEYPGKIVFKVVGLAASAYTYIAAASVKSGNSCVIAPTGFMMIHNAQSWASGDYRDMSHAEKRLKTANQAVINAYQKKTGLSSEELQKIMDEDTWLHAQLAVSYGFADEIMYEGEGEPLSESVIGQIKNQYQGMLTNFVSNKNQLMNSIVLTTNPFEKAKQGLNPLDIEDKANIDLAKAKVEIEKQRFGGI